MKGAFQFTTPHADLSHIKPSEAELSSEHYAIQGNTLPKVTI